MVVVVEVVMVKLLPKEPSLDPAPPKLSNPDDPDDPDYPDDGGLLNSLLSRHFPSTSLKPPLQYRHF